MNNISKLVGTEILNTIIMSVDRMDEYIYRIVLLNKTTNKITSQTVIARNCISFYKVGYAYDRLYIAGESALINCILLKTFDIKSGEFVK